MECNSRAKRSGVPSGWRHPGGYRGCVKNSESAYNNLQVRKADPVPASSLKATQQTRYPHLLFSKLYQPISFIAFDSFSESSGHHQS